MNDKNELYYAKSKREDGTQELLCKHLKKVSEMAGKFGAQIDNKRAAELCGKLHDFGKYSESFKGVLEGKCTHIDHALCGAAFLFLYRKDRLRRSLEFKNARTEAGTTTRRSLD